jgi:hypothetical protein
MAAFGTFLPLAVSSMQRRLSLWSKNAGRLAGIAASVNADSGEDCQREYRPWRTDTHARIRLEPAL